MSYKARLLVIDDERTNRAILKRSFPECDVIEAANSQEALLRLSDSRIDVVLLDIMMPGMDGFETTQWISKNYPFIKILALSMLSDEKSIIKMFRLGAKGYLMKNTDPEELKTALDSLMNKNVYLSEYVSGKLVSGLQDGGMGEKEIVLNEKEREFLRWTCTELSYKDIAEKMHVSPRTVDDYRQSLFNKLKVNSRVGLVMYAIKNGIVEL